MVVGIVLMVLGKLYLLLSLRRDEGNINGHQKKERYWGTAGARKKYNCPQYDSFMGIGEVLGLVRSFLEQLQHTPYPTRHL
jgi:hypothetical protein